MLSSGGDPEEETTILTKPYARVGLRERLRQFLRRAREIEPETSLYFVTSSREGLAL
jgi:hypothetical protein